MIGISVRSRCFFKAGAVSHVYLAFDNGLDPLANARLIKRNGSIHHTVIGDGNRILSALLGAARDFRNPTRSIKKAIFTVQMQMNELSHAPNSFLHKCFLVRSCPPHSKSFATDD